MEQIVKTSPAFDKRHTDPNKNYGIRSMLIWFILKGDKGAVQFQIDTGLYLPHVAEELWNRSDREYNPFRGDGWDIGYHSIVPQYEGQTQMDCEMFGQCYYDGSSLQASEFFPKFLEGGSDVVWEMLEERYTDMFGEMI